MKKIFLMALALIMSVWVFGQQLPYVQLPDCPPAYSAGTVAARMIDGLGFRYYWATDGLREQDLSFRPGEDARSAEETVDHILELSYVVVNATLKQPNEGADLSVLFEAKRKQTLINLKMAADILRSATDEEMVGFEIDFGKSNYPFWYTINGPIADALWHCGQIVSFRRSSGNPFNSKVSVFQGKLRE